MEITELYKLFLEADGICTDTRKIVPGTLFFALKGANFNGNAFAQKAIEEGCVAAIVDEEDKAGDKIFYVKDVLKALQDIALHHRRQFDIPVLGITGSNGKTTTKELIGAVLEKKYNLLITEGNLNNHLGVPFTLLRLTGDHEMAIIEMGANKPGDIKELAEIAEPDFGVITNIGAAHIEGFGSIQGVINTKTELYRNIEERAGVLFVNQDDEILTSNLPEGIKTVSYSSKSESGIIGKVENLTPFLEFSWKVGDGISRRVASNLVGSYNLYNFLTAICIGDYFDVDHDEISKALAEYIPSNNRSQVQKTERNTLVVDCYNANPTSMKAALENFEGIHHENKWLILGSMRELGHIEKEEHQKVATYLLSSDVNYFLVGEEFKGMAENNWFSTTQDLIASGQLSQLNNGLVLLKASRGIGLEKLIPEL